MVVLVVGAVVVVVISFGGVAFWPFVLEGIEVPKRHEKSLKEKCLTQTYKKTSHMT